MPKRDEIDFRRVLSDGITKTLRWIFVSNGDKWLRWSVLSAIVSFICLAVVDANYPDSGVPPFLFLAFIVSILIFCLRIIVRIFKILKLIFTHPKEVKEAIISGWHDGAERD